MSVEVAPVLVLDHSLSQEESTTSLSDRQILNVWTAPSLDEINIDEHHKEEMTKPQPSSEKDDMLSEGETERERHQKAILVAMELLNGVFNEGIRKTSDPSVYHRNTEVKKKSLKKQRCLSDTNNYPFETPDDNSSAVGCDSGIAVSSRVVEQTSSGISDGESSPVTVKRPRQNFNQMKRTGSLDEKAMRRLQQEDDGSSHHSGGSSLKATRGRFTKHLSLCSSTGGSSSNYSSLYECRSIATDILSGLGFDDFESPLLIPDRFIPKDTEYAKPTLMKEHAALISNDPSYLPPPSPTSPPPFHLSLHNTESNVNVVDQELPLGATADNFLKSKSDQSFSPPLSPPSKLPIRPINEDWKYSNVIRSLETVPEETASDLSPSPRWLSPRVSLDHSLLDLSFGQLGATLSIVNRKRSLPNREGYKLSMESLHSEQDSIYFSVTSYEDEIAKDKKEQEDYPPILPPDDMNLPRRRRRGVHGAPVELLSWLQHQPISEEGDDGEAPWPFNEQLRLRRSLTEIQQRRSRTSSSDTLGERSLSPLSCSDPLEGVFPRRFSINGPLVAPVSLPMETRRLSLPSNSSFHHYTPPTSFGGTVLEPTIEETESRKSSEDNQKSTTKLPPGMTRDQALGYKQDSMVLRSQVENIQEKLHNAEKVRRTLEEEHHKRLSDTEEWLHSELWMKDRRCRELEEMLENHKRELVQLQQNYQVGITRAKEDVRNLKDIEIKELHHKMEKKSLEQREKISKLEDECKQLRFKENQLLKKTNQQDLKKENEELQREIVRLKEQIRKEKQISAAVTRDKNLEVKQFRSKLQIEKEEALKQLKMHLQKSHEIELNSIKQLIKTGTPVETTPSKSSSRVTGVTPPNRMEIKKLHYQMERLNSEVHVKRQEVKELQQQLQILHKEHLILEKELSKH